MAVLTGPVYVNNPHPLKPRYGLFTVAGPILDLPAHASTGGLQYESAICEQINGYEIACADMADKEFGGGPELITGTPFAVQAGLECGTVGMDAGRARTMVLQRLLAGEQARVEDIFSQGTFGQSPSLANNAAAVTLTAVTGLVEAIGALENFLYATSEFGSLGVVHVPLRYAAQVIADAMLHLDGDIWRTALGTAVSFGNYAGLDALGADPAAGHTNLYITGPVGIWRARDEDIFVSPYEGAVNTTTNQVTMLAEREYVLTFDCHVAAVDVAL